MSAHAHDPDPHDVTLADVAIICVTHNSASLVSAFLHAAFAALTAGSLRVVVVDSASTDGTLEVVGAASETAEVCILAENRGYAASINVGVDHVRRTGGARAFVVANPDVLMAPGSVTRLVDALSLGRVGVSCPMILDQHGVRDDSLSRLPSVWAGFVGSLLGTRWAAALGAPVEVQRDPAAYEQAHAVGWACGGLLAISAECLDDVGPWNEEYFMYEEEVDFCERVAAAGLLVWYVPDAVVTRTVSHDARAPWRHALAQVNRVRREGRYGRAGRRRAQLILEDLLRLHRPRSRAGLWAVVTDATPEQVMERYHFGSHITVRSQDAATAAPYTVLGWTGEPVGDPPVLGGPATGALP